MLFVERGREQVTLIVYGLLALTTIADAKQI